MTGQRHIAIAGASGLVGNSLLRTALDEVYLAVGTTMHQAGSRDAFRAVDLAINLAVTQAALAAGAQRIGLVSAMAANPKSLFFYNRVKGELEQALTALSPDGLVIARPSMLLGDRQTLGQSVRLSETLTKYVSQAVRPLIPRDYRPIEAQKVARALLSHVPTAEQTIILRSGEMQMA
ncbi:Rossmann-fold NAD(P)-binding domain-containing protein [Vibrio spartinae]|nr:epimerase [Vibrio spartinae]